MDRCDLERLGHYVVSRRVSLGYRNRTDLADSLQFTVRTLADIEHGVRKASPGTYAMRGARDHLGALWPRLTQGLSRSHASRTGDASLAPMTPRESARRS
jgi:hypothetical protein